MLNSPNAQFCSATQPYTAAQSGNVVLDDAFGHVKTEAYFFIRLCPADEKQNLRFPWRELDEPNRGVR
jgi:hypothetical protein